MNDSTYIACRRQRIMKLSGICLTIEQGDEVLASELPPLELARLVHFGWLRKKKVKLKVPKDPVTP